MVVGHHVVAGNWTRRLLEEQSVLFFFFKLGIFFIYISSAIPKVPYTLPPTPTSWPWRSPVLGHIKFARLMGLSFHWWPTRPSSDTYAARDTSSGALVSSYCCSTYRVADPPSFLSTFTSSSIGGPVIHPIAGWEHPLLCLPGPSIVSQETARPVLSHGKGKPVCSFCSLQLLFPLSLSILDIALNFLFMLPIISRLLHSAFSF
jgi:hypothetical protein